MSENSNTYEMLWDCQYCGTKKNLGLTHRFCPNCGAPQNPDSRYFPSDEEKIAVKDHKYVGVDVICPNCSELNSAAAEFCGQCAAPLTDAARAKRLQDQIAMEGEAFQSSGSRDLVKEKFEEEQRRIGNLPPEPSQKKKRKIGSNIPVMAGIAAVFALVVGVIGLLNWTEETRVVVDGHEWERSITIQEYRDFSVRSWRDSPPAGDSVSIQVGSCSREVRSYRQVDTGRETCTTRRIDNGDGTFSEVNECSPVYEQEAVYDDMCTWRGRRWEQDRVEREQGQRVSDTPRWPSLSLSCEGQRRIGCERESDRDERYTVRYAATENDNIFHCNYPQQEWASIPVESIWIGDVRVVDGGGLRCDGLRAVQ